MARVDVERCGGGRAEALWSLMRGLHYNMANVGVADRRRVEAVQSGCGGRDIWWFC